MTRTIDAWYDAYVVQHPNGTSTADIRAYLEARMRTHLENMPRDLDAEARRAVQAELPRLRESRKEMTRTNFIQILDYVTGKSDSMEITAISTMSLPTGAPAGVDKTLKFWTLHDIHSWLDARRQNRDAANTAYILDAETAQLLEGVMVARGAVMLGDLIADTRQGGDAA